jgi:polysaccharide export outer membrane protein
MNCVLRITFVGMALTTLACAQTAPFVPPDSGIDSSWNTSQDGQKSIPTRTVTAGTQPAHPSAPMLGGTARSNVPMPNSLVTTTTSGPVKLSPGDLLEVGVFDSPELTTRARVNSDGNITFPLLGSLHVGGSSPEQTQKAIEKQLADKDFVKDPQVSVFVVEYANQGVSVLGEVNKPGVYPVMGSHQLFDFVSAAGGFTVRAGRSVTIAHAGDGQPDVIRLGHDPSLTSGNPVIAAGDTIYVGQAGLVYVVGDVAHPGGFLMDSGEKLTVLQALALAQGVKPTAALKGARLVRTTDQGRVEIPLDLRRIMAFQEQDPTLQDQDIVYVPNSAARTGFRRAMDAALQVAVGAAIYGRY